MSSVCAIAKAMVSRHGLVRAKQLAEAGISHSWVTLLVRMRELRRYPPGVYGRRFDYPPAVCAVVKWPNVVVTGLSALALHRLCSEPRVLSLALDAHAHVPRSNELPFTWSWCQSLADDPDVMIESRFGVRVRLFSPTRALFECLKKLEAHPVGLAHQAVHEMLRLRMHDFAAFEQLCDTERAGRDARDAFKLLVATRKPIPVPREALRNPDLPLLPRDDAEWARDEPVPF